MSVGDPSARAVKVEELDTAQCWQLLETVTLGRLAHMIADEYQPQPPVIIVSQDRADRYVPSTRRIREELGVKETVDLPSSIRSTIAWHNDASDS